VVVTPSASSSYSFNGHDADHVPDPEHGIDTDTEDMGVITVNSLGRHSNSSASQVRDGAESNGQLNLGAFGKRLNASLCHVQVWSRSLLSNGACNSLSISFSCFKRLASALRVSVHSNHVQIGFSSNLSNCVVVMAANGVA
jgi:hypothetical protein